MKFNLVAGMLGLVYSNCKPRERGVEMTQEGCGAGTPAGNTSANPRKKPGGEVRETAEAAKGAGAGAERTAGAGATWMQARTHHFLCRIRKKLNAEEVVPW